MFLGFGGLGGNNGRQSLLKDDVLVSLSTPGPTSHMLLGAVGLPVAAIFHAYDLLSILPLILPSTLLEHWSNI